MAPGPDPVGKRPKLGPAADVPMLTIGPSSMLAAELHPTSAMVVTDVPGCTRVAWHVGKSRDELDNEVKDLLFKLTGQKKLWVSHGLN